MKVTVLQSESAIVKPKKRSLKGTLKQTPTQMELIFTEVRSSGEKHFIRAVRKRDVTTYSHSTDGKRFKKFQGERSIVLAFENSTTISKAFAQFKSMRTPQALESIKSKYVGNLDVVSSARAKEHERIFDLVNSFKANKIVSKTAFKNLFGASGVSDLFAKTADIKSFVSAIDKILEGKKPTAKQLEVINRVVTRKVTGETKKAQDDIKKKISKFVKLDTPRKPKDRMLDGPDSNRGVRRKPTAAGSKKPSGNQPTLSVVVTNFKRTETKKAKLKVSNNKKASVEIVLQDGRVSCTLNTMKLGVKMTPLAAVRKLMEVSGVKVPDGLEAALKSIKTSKSFTSLRSFQNAVLQDTSGSTQSSKAPTRKPTRVNRK